MKETSEGFLVPLIDQKTCTKCGLCREVCPILTDTYQSRFELPQAYAAWSVDELIRADSSSGGVFSVLARNVLNKYGVVFGAAFDSEFKLRHYEAKTSSELIKLRGSKYLQSNIGNTYTKIESYLSSGQNVMFVGTPCQVGGLYGYLRKDYKKLITCDLVCHGVPSQRFFDEYLLYLQHNGYNNFDDIYFRDKKGWGHSIILTDRSTTKKEIYLDGYHTYYLKVFIKNLVSRKSCYSCKFARVPRVGDFTLGDFWGLGKVIPFHFDKSKGVSLLLVNSDRGSAVLQSCKNELFLEKRQLSEAITMNPRINSVKKYPSERDTFLTDINIMPIEKIWKKYRLQEKCTVQEIIRKSVSFAIGQKGVDFLKSKLKR